MAFDLTRVLRALLFASPGPLSLREIQTVVSRFHEQKPAEKGGDESADATEDLVLVSPSEVPSLVTASQIREAMEIVGRYFEETGEVFRLQETHQGYRLVTANDSAVWVRLLHNAPKPARLSRAALETLAIVAYRQPVVRAEIESIRGVSADNALNRLLERELIRIIGRADLPGKTIVLTGAMIPFKFGSSDGLFNLGSALAFVQSLPAGVYVAMNGLYFRWDRVRKNRATGRFEDTGPA